MCDGLERAEAWAGDRRRPLVLSCVDVATEHAFEEFGAPGAMDALASRFGSASWWAFFRETEGLNDAAPNVRIVDGPLRIEGSLALRAEQWAYIVDGDLELGGDLVCETPNALTSTLIVTGSIRARNIIYSNSARIGVSGDTTLTGFIVGTWGDGGAVFWTDGTLDARGVLLDSNTAISAGRYATLILGGGGWQEFTPDFRNGETDVFVPDVLASGGPNLDFHRAEQRVRAGHSVFVPEREAQWRASKGLRPWP